MNPTRVTHRLPVTLAGLAAAALVLPACQGTGAAASHRPHHHQHAAHAMVQPPNGMTFADLQDLANLKRDIGALGSAHTPTPHDSGLAACRYPLTMHNVPAAGYPKIRAEFAGSRWPDLRAAGTAYIDLAVALRTAHGTDGYQTVWFTQRLSATCAKHGQPLDASTRPAVPPPPS
jgi:hypothetical protein